MKTELHIPLHSPLKDYVTAVFEISGPYNLKETILPKGIFEMVFNLGGNMSGVLPFEEQFTHTPKCFIQGVHKHALQVNFSGVQHLFCIRLRPHKVQSLVGVVPCELNNLVIDLTLINKLYDSIWHQLVEADSFEARLKIIASFFPAHDKTDCPRTQKLSELFSSDSVHGLKSIAHLSGQVYYSPRHLNRKVHNLFGMSTEELLVYKKFLHAVNLMHADNLSLTEVAHEAGFYDQAHFCKVFKNYSGITAKVYKKSKSTIPFHLF